jgi:Putative peptidoglycan binding domain
MLETRKQSAMPGRDPWRRAAVIAVCALAIVGVLSSPARADQSAGSSMNRTATHSTKRSRKKKSTKARGQQKIDPQRSQEIQQALIREHYLTGEPTGAWDPASEEAMRRYQADNGWQNKTVPDSRALIKLGLGPSKDHLLNPDSAMTTVPDRPTSAAISPTSSTSPAVANPTTPTTSSPDPSRPQ